MATHAHDGACHDAAAGALRRPPSVVRHPLRGAHEPDRSGRARAVVLPRRGDLHGHARRRRNARAVHPALLQLDAGGDLQIDAAFQLDQLSMVMVLVITGVGALIHIFSVGYMRDDPGYPRYFAYLNLFVFFMLVLVLGRELSGDVRRLGRRGTLLVPAHRLLVQREGERRRGQEGVHRQPHRRLRLPRRDVHVVRQPRRAGLRRRECGGERDFPVGGVLVTVSASSSFWAAPARARRSRSTSGCRTPWRVRRRSPRSSMRRRWSRRACTSSPAATCCSRWHRPPA